MYTISRDLTSQGPPPQRRGAFMIVAFLALMATMGFVAFSIDTGNIALNKTIMQNAVDAAALAAAMEITNAVENAPPEEQDPTAYAREQAKIVAADTAAMNGVYVDPSVDVEFGLRWYNPATEKFEIQWGVEPANAVKVKARRDNVDISAPDGKLPMMFAGVLGDDSVSMASEAVAFIESRDISVVLDFSGSMRYDSLYRSSSISKLGRDAIAQNLDQMFWELGLSDAALGTLDNSDPTNPSSSRTASPHWLTVYSPKSSKPSDPDVHVTFQYDSAKVVSDRAFKEVRLQFSDGNSQTFSHPAVQGTYQGSGRNAGKDIETVWVMYSREDVLVSGQEGSGCRPKVDVTFDGDGTSVFIESTKDLSNVVLEFEDGSHHKFDGLSQGPTGIFAGSGVHEGKTIVGVWVKSGCNKSGDGPGYGERFDSPLTGRTSIAVEFNDTNENVKAYFGLADVDYPYPSGSWDRYIDYVRNDRDINRGNLREQFGGRTFMHYLLDEKPYHWQTPDLAKTSHFPFHAVRKGNELFLDFLSNLGFGDHVGLVSYDQYRRYEESLNTDDTTIDLTADPLGSHYDDLKTIMRHKQASHYYARTNIGGGLRNAREMIRQHGRPGSRPTILLMTDGNANVYENAAGKNNLESGFSDDGYYAMPEGFDWSTIEYDDGSSFEVEDDNSYQAKSRIFALSEALKAVEEGVTVHTLAVGAGADRDLMRAIAHIGGGEYISVEGDLSVEDLLSEVEAGFYRIAALVPPARLANPDEISP